MPASIRTLYLVPHAHTDLGYTHDPLIAWELHDDFVDRAIDLCEATTALPPAARFHWTIEVFATLEHWWARRDATAHARLLTLLRAGRIDLGLRYTNGTFLHNPLNLDWEVERAFQFCRTHGLPAQPVVQNDINGLARAHARRFAAGGATGLLMGLNTTMGVSPQPRPGAFWWDLGEQQQLLVWHGWIYNRIGRWLHLHDLPEKLPAAWDGLCERLPADYPFDFMMMSGTIGDNVGPFARLPEAVARFNALGRGREVRLVTTSQFLAHVARTPGLRRLAGDWNDAWLFGAGAMPQEVAMLRRAERRVEVLAAMQRTGVADTRPAAALMERAQHEISLACEHTYESHTTAGDHTLGDDGKRQWVQSQVAFTQAESLSMLALRRVLFAKAAALKVNEPSVLLVNPTDHALPLRIRWNRRLAEHITTSEVLEHLTQFDREPTLEGLARDADLGVPAIALPPHSVQLVALQPLPPVSAALEPVPDGTEIALAGLRLRIDGRGALTSLRRDGDSQEWVNPGFATPFGCPVLERPDPATPLKYKSEAEKRDPSDSEWNPDLRFLRQAAGRLLRLERRVGADVAEVIATYADSPVRAISYRLDSLTPGLLHLELELRLDDEPSHKALYLPLPFQLPGTGDVTFAYDSCGEWVRAPDDQLPGSGTSFYETYRGVTVERGGACVYAIGADHPLWQLGGFTAGHPHARIDRASGTLIACLYNNYWYTNFPSTVPGWFRSRFVVGFGAGPAQPREADRLYHHFHTPYFSHPVWPPRRS